MLVLDYIEAVVDESLLFEEFKADFGPAEQVDEVQRMAEWAVSIECERYVDVDPLYFVGFLLVIDKEDYLIPCHDKRTTVFALI